MGIRRSIDRAVWMGGWTVLGFLLAVPNLFGQDPNVRVTVFGSGSFLKGERTFVVNGDAKRSDYANGGKGGFRVTADLDPHLAVEGAYSFGRNNLRIFDITPTTTRERAFGIRVHQVTGNLLYYFKEPKEKVRFFVTAGLGLARYSPTDKAKTSALVEFVDGPAAISSSNKVEFNYGGGLEARAGSNFGVRFDVRDHITKIPRFGDPEVPTAGIADFYPVSGVVHDIESSFGIVFYFK